MIDYKLLEKKGGDLYESRNFFKEGQVLYIYIYIFSFAFKKKIYGVDEYINKFSI